MIGQAYRGTIRWSRNRQAAAIAAWISFLGAALASMLFFAVFDPAELAASIDPDAEIGREAGYAAGFFFFWLVCALCSGITAWLVRTAPARGGRRD